MPRSVARRSSIWKRVAASTAVAVRSAACACFVLGCSVYGPTLLGSDDATLQAGGGDSGWSGAAGFGVGGASEAGGGDAQSAGTSASSGSDAGGSESGAGGALAGAAGHCSWCGSAGAELGGQSGGPSTSAGASGMAEAAGSGDPGAGGSSGAAGANAAGSGGAMATAGAPAVELARGKKVIASTQQVTHEAPYGNDGDGTTRWCAKDGTFPQWWRVDLGSVRTLRDFSVSFEHPERKYTYKIETSSNDAVYTLQASMSGTGAVHSGTFPGYVQARYVRVTVTDGVPFVDGTGHSWPTWACFFEFAINGY